MKIIHFLLSLALLCIGINANAQLPPYQWARQLGSVGQNSCNDIVYDHFGNILVTGSFSGTVDFDPGPGIQSLTSNGNRDMFVASYSSTGDLNWARSAGSAKSDFGARLTADRFGNVLCIGSTQDTVDFDPGPATATISPSNLYAGAGFLLKLDIQGNFVYVKNMVDRTSGMFTNFGVAVTDNDEILYTAIFQDTVDADPGAATYSLVANALSNILITKLDANGSWVWTKKIEQISNGSLDMLVYDLVTDQAGDVFICGEFSGTVDFDPSSSVYSLTATGAADGFYMKLSPNGVFVWASRFGSQSGPESWPSQMVCDGNFLYIVGFFRGTVDFDGSSSVSTLTDLGFGDAFLLKATSTTGTFQWVGSAGSTASDWFNSITLDKYSNVIVTGFSSGIIDVDPGPGVVSYTPSGEDAYLIQYSSAGSLIDSKQIGGTSSQRSWALDYSPNGDIVIAGNFSVSILPDPASSVSLTANAGTDAFFVRYGLCADPAVSGGYNAPICSGQQATVSASASSPISWYSTVTSSSVIAIGSVLTTPTLSAGQYTWYAAAASCTDNSARAAVTISVSPLPQLTVTAVPATICVNQHAKLTATGANSFTWSTGAQQSTVSVSPASTTVYSLTGEDITTGCSASASVSVKVNPCTGLEDEKQFTFSVFPNPSAGEVTFNTPGDATVQICSSIGQVLTSFKVHRSLSINLDFPQGIYFAICSIGDQRAVAKVLIQ